MRSLPQICNRCIRQNCVNFFLMKRFKTIQTASNYLHPQTCETSPECLHTANACIQSLDLLHYDRQESCLGCLLVVAGSTHQGTLRAHMQRRHTIITSVSSITCYKYHKIIHHMTKTMIHHMTKTMISAYNATTEPNHSSVHSSCWRIHQTLIFLTYSLRI